MKPASSIPWFLREMARIVNAAEDSVQDDQGLPEDTALAFRRLKALGFADAAAVARLTGQPAAQVTALRERLEVCAPSISASIPVPANSPPPHLICIQHLSRAGFGTPACEADPDRSAEDRHPRRRPQPHRAGHRIRLLLCPCLPMR